MSALCWMVAVGALGLLPSVAGAQAPSPPPGVTAAQVEEGGKIFKGKGICFSCHGQDAKGVKGLGADLTDRQWIHSKGSYEEIVAQIKKGVPAAESTTKLVMPPNGGTNLSDAEVRWVAAYVWTLGQGKQ